MVHKRVFVNVDADIGARRFTVLSKEIIAELANMRTDAAVASLYLDITPQRISDEPVAVRVRRMLANARTSEADGRAVEAALEPIGRFFRTEFGGLNKTGQGLVLFSAPALDLWQVYMLPLPVEDNLTIASRPAVRPLVDLLENTEPTGLIFIDRSHARLYRIITGEIGAWAELQSDDVPGQHKQGGWAQARYQRHIDDQVQQHYKRVVAEARSFFTENPVTRLIMAGDSTNTLHFESGLPTDLREKVGARIPMERFTGVNDVLERVMLAQEEIERAAEAQRVDTLYSALPQGRAVVGVSDTLQALAEQRVMLLLIAEGLSVAGAECAGCGWLTDQVDVETCALCGTPLAPTDDVIEAAMAPALRQVDDIDVIHGADRDRLMAECGGIGAILRY